MLEQIFRKFTTNIKGRRWGGIHRRRLNRMTLSSSCCVVVIVVLLLMCCRRQSVLNVYIYKAERQREKELICIVWQSIDSFGTYTYLNKIRGSRFRLT